MKKKLVTIFLLSIVLAFVGYLLAKKLNRREPTLEIQTSPEAQTVKQLEMISEVAPNSDKQSPKADAQPAKPAKLQVPFIVQAPFGNWSDPVFQNACEESSIVMVMGWLNGDKTISPQEAQQQILAIVDFENKAFGYNADTDVSDVQKIFQQYYHKQNIRMQENISVEDIKNELQKGNLVLVPAFGQALGNPNYTPPGPIAHMLVIIGYDSATKEFITNDSGTRHGAGYRYAEKVLFDAIWEYPSGPGPLDPPKAVRKKAMLVVQPS